MLILLAQPLSAQNNLDAAIKLVETEKFAQAEPLLAEILKREPNNHSALYYLGRAIVSQDDEKRAKEATSWLEKAVKLQPDNSDYHLWLGRAYGTQAQNANVLKQASLAGKTKEHFERAVKLDPNSVEARLSMIDYYRMAPGIMGGSKDKAKQEAEVVKRLNAWRGGFAMIEIYNEEKNWAGVERELKALEKAYPDSSTIPVQLVVLHQTAGQFDRAFAAIDELLKTNPDNMAAVFQIGRAAAVSGQRLEAGEAALKRYLQYTPPPNQPAHWAAHFRLGNIYEKMGRKDLARAAYQETLRVNPAHEEAKKNLQRLK